MAITTFVRNGIAIGDKVEYRNRLFECTNFLDFGDSMEIKPLDDTKDSLIVATSECRRVPPQRTMYQIMFFTEDGDEDYHCWAASPAEAVKLFKEDNEGLPIYKVFEMREIDRELWDNQPET